MDQIAMGALLARFFWQRQLHERFVDRLPVLRFSTISTPQKSLATYLANAGVLLLQLDRFQVL
jgi:hypothetical protein